MPPPIGYRLITSALTAMHGRRFSAMLAAAKSPNEAQSFVLRRILAANAKPRLAGDTVSIRSVQLLTIAAP